MKKTNLVSVHEGVVREHRTDRYDHKGDEYFYRHLDISVLQKPVNFYNAKQSIGFWELDLERRSFRENMRWTHHRKVGGAYRVRLCKAAAWLFHLITCVQQLQLHAVSLFHKFQSLSIQFSETFE